MIALKDIPVRFVLTTWPLTWRAIRAINNVVPSEGRIRDAFKAAVFSRFWDKWYKYAYDSYYRDTFFEAIVAFLYNYQIRKGDVIVQIGASFGEETARFARAVGRKGRVFAIEPEERNVEVMHSLLSQRRYPQVTIIQIAVSDTTGRLDFFIGGGKEHRLSNIPAKNLTYEWWGVIDHLNENRYRRTESVAVDTLDNILRSYALDRIDFVLVETNGNELEVVRGMNEVLSITKRIGARGHVLRDGVPTFIEIEQVLQQKGYKTAVTSEGMVLGSRTT